jgi:hypothetical protein
MARISTRNLLDGGQRVTPPTSVTPTSRTAPAIDPQDVKDPVTGLTPAQTAARAAAQEVAASTGGTYNPQTGMVTAPKTATKTVTPTTTTTVPPVSSVTPAGTDPALTALLQQLQQQNLQAQLAAQAEADRRTAAAQAERQSAYDLLYQQFNQYGLGALVEPLKGFITSGINPAEFTIRLRETDAYKKRFAANQSRIAKGLRALSEAEYITLEDQYQNVMRQYGLPASYYTRGDMGRQEGFEKFISEDVSPVELEDRISNAQERVLQGAPEIGRMLRQFYPDINNGDILAYALDPRNALNAIKRKITAAEIGAGAAQAGLETGMARAEELAQYGVSKETARQGFQAIAGILPRGSQLAEFYKQGPYTQTTAEQEVFGLAGATEAEKQRRKLTELETAAFSGQAGPAGGALARDRAGAF